MDSSKCFISFSGGGYTVSGLVSTADWARIESGAEHWIQVNEAQSVDGQGRTVDFGEITVLFRDGSAEPRPDSPEHC